MIRNDVCKDSCKIIIKKQFHPTFVLIRMTLSLRIFLNFVFLIEIRLGWLVCVMLHGYLLGVFS